MDVHSPPKVTSVIHHVPPSLPIETWHQILHETIYDPNVFTISIESVSIVHVELANVRKVYEQLRLLRLVCWQVDKFIKRNYAVREGGFFNESKTVWHPCPTFLFRNALPWHKVYPSYPSTQELQDLIETRKGIKMVNQLIFDEILPNPRQRLDLFKTLGQCHQLSYLALRFGSDLITPLPLPPKFSSTSIFLPSLRLLSLTSYLLVDMKILPHLQIPRLEDFILRVWDYEGKATRMCLKDVGGRTRLSGLSLPRDNVSTLFYPHTLAHTFPHLCILRVMIPASGSVSDDDWQHVPSTLHLLIFRCRAKSVGEVVNDPLWRAVNRGGTNVKDVRIEVDDGCCNSSIALQRTWGDAIAAPAGVTLSIVKVEEGLGSARILAPSLPGSRWY